MLMGGAAAEAAVADFKADFEAYEALRLMEHPPQPASAMLNRSPFATTPVQQILRGLQSNDWALTEDLLRVLECRNKGICATQLIEDFHNIQKNEKANERPSGPNRFRTPQRSFAALLKRQVESHEHRFQTLKPDQPLSEKALVLARDNFFPTVQHQSIDFSSLISTKQNATWFSPLAANVPLPAADLAALRVAHKQNRFEELGNLWLGFFAESSHQVCVKLLAARDASGQWYAGLHYFPNSACLMMPVSVETVPQHQDKYWVRPLRTERPVLIPIFSLDGLQAFAFRFKSWAGQRRDFPKAIPHWRPGVRAFRVGRIRPILQIAAEAAWWSLSKSCLCDISDYLGLGRGSSETLFSLLMPLTMKVLAVDEEKALEVLKLRIKNMRKTVRENDAILVADEAVAVLDIHDREEVAKQKATVKDDQALCASFRTEFAAARTKVRAAAKSSGRGSKSKPSPVRSTSTGGLASSRSHRTFSSRTQRA